MTWPRASVLYAKSGCEFMMAAPAALAAATAIEQGRIASKCGGAPSMAAIVSTGKPCGWQRNDPDGSPLEEWHRPCGLFLPF